MDLKFFIMLVIGSFVDSLFLTILYYKKKHVKRYWLMVVVFTFIIVSFNICLSSIYRPFLTLGIMIVINYFWTQDKYSIAYICSFFLISFFLVELPIFYLLEYTDKGFLASNILRVFLITTLSTEHKHNLEFNFLSITLKMFFVIFCFLTVVGGYIVFKYKG